MKWILLWRNTVLLMVFVAKHYRNFVRNVTHQHGRGLPSVQNIPFKHNCKAVPPISPLPWSLQMWSPNTVDTGANSLAGRAPEREPHWTKLCVLAGGGKAYLDSADLRCSPHPAEHGLKKPQSWPGNGARCSASHVSSLYGELF